MPYLNNVVIQGHAGRDAELRYTTNGTAVCNFSVALNTGTKDKPHTTWIDVQSWKDTAERLGGVAKGDLVQVVGRLRQEEWTDKTNGQKRSKMLVVADRAANLSAWKRDEHKSDESQVERGDNTTPPARHAPTSTPSAPTQPELASESTDGDDNIPF